MTKRINVLRCPACDQPGNTVQISTFRNKENKVIRQRKCQCGHLFTSVERIEDNRAEAESRDQIARIKAILGVT